MVVVTIAGGAGPIAKSKLSNKIRIFTHSNLQ
jgi:hypothetical protein